MEYKEIKCLECGEILATLDWDYITNNPNASDGYIEDLRAKCSCQARDGEYITCEDCGDVICFVSNKYMYESPNGSDMYISQQRAEHEKYCSANQYSFNDWHNDVSQWAKKEGINLPHKYTPKSLINLVIEQGKSPETIPCPPDRMWDTNIHSLYFEDKENQEQWFSEIDEYDWDGKYISIRCTC